MITKKLSRLVGLKIEAFDHFLNSGQIKAQEARLIPTLKTGDEMALTSILFSALRLVKEYRDGIFRDIKLSKSGKTMFFTEVSFPEISNSRIDGLILVVKGGVIKEAAFCEMKNKNAKIDAEQISSYISVAKQLGVKTMITVSNEFVSDPSHSPINVKRPKGFNLLHFSWTYLLTRGHLLLFKNEHNIKDEDQVEIMREVLHYLESPVSGVMGYTQMKPGWKELADNVRAQKPLKTSDNYIKDAVISWHEEEKDITLLMSRKLGVLVKPTSRTPESIKADVKRVVEHNYMTGSLAVKNSVSDIKIKAEFERRMVFLAVKIVPPMDKGTRGRISWMAKQLENCRKRAPEVFDAIQANLWIEANIKYAREHEKIRLSELADLIEQTKGKEIQAFNVVMAKSFGAGFASSKKFIQLIEQMVLDYYEGIVQHMTNWNRPAPRLSR